MSTHSRGYSLRHSVLFFLSIAPPSFSDNSQWPYNLPAHIKYYPEDEVHVKRDIQIQQRLSWERPVAVRKMSADEGEKFFLEYWEFNDDKKGNRNHEPTVEEIGFTNITDPMSLSAPFRVHANQLGTFGTGFRFAVRNLFQKRDFQCPTGTQNCASIDRPNSCCPTSQTCIQVEDTGLGDVGCCPQGQSCSGTISSCDADAGLSSCPGSPNGGCCIPKFKCQGVGCVYYDTAVIVPQPSSPPPPSSTPPPETSTSAPPLTCSSGFQSCPASQGGGCCPSDASCDSVFCSPPTASAAPPVRPTSEPPATTAPPDITDQSDDVCPTGFYMCSAYYRGGCCRVGRACDSTSCPDPATATIVNSNGITIAAPSGSLSPVSRACASGWYSCAASQGGDCCPTGYNCGEVACTAKESGGGEIAKEAPSLGVGPAVSFWLLISVGAVAGIGMIVL